MSGGGGGGGAACDVNKHTATVTARARARCTVQEQGEAVRVPLPGLACVAVQHEDKGGQREGVATKPHTVDGLKHTLICSVYTRDKDTRKELAAVRSDRPRGAAAWHPGRGVHEAWR